MVRGQTHASQVTRGEPLLNALTWHSAENGAQKRARLAGMTCMQKNCTPLTESEMAKPQVNSEKKNAGTKQGRPEKTNESTTSGEATLTTCRRDNARMYLDEVRNAMCEATKSTAASRRTRDAQVAKPPPPGPAGPGGPSRSNGNLCDRKQHRHNRVMVEHSWGLERQGRDTTRHETLSLANPRCGPITTLPNTTTTIQLKNLSISTCSSCNSSPCLTLLSH